MNKKITQGTLAILCVTIITGALIQHKHNKTTLNNNTQTVVCTEQYDPVCAADGETYSNSCYAGNQHIQYKGECKPNHQSLQKELTINKQKRGKSHITTYTLQQTLSCFCMREYTLPIQYNIINNIIQKNSITYVNINKTVTNAPTLLTVVDIFAKIQNAINKKADTIKITYHKKYGYPQKLFIDRNKNTVDEEERYVWNMISP